MSNVAPHHKSHKDGANMTTAESLLELRKKNNLSQEEFTEKLMITRQADGRAALELGNAGANVGMAKETTCRA